MIRTFTERKITDIFDDLEIEMWPEGDCLFEFRCQTADIDIAKVILECNKDGDPRPLEMVLNQHTMEQMKAVLEFLRKKIDKEFGAGLTKLKCLDLRYLHKEDSKDAFWTDGGLLAWTIDKDGWYFQLNVTMCIVGYQ